MKKLFAIPVLMILLVSFVVPVVMAQETVEVTEEDEQELEVFEIPYGAHMRLLQLERAISRNILIGTEVMTVLEKNHPENDYTDMQLILGDMETLLEEVRDMELEGEPEDLAREFLEIKKESINLTRDFKRLASEYLTPEDRSEIGRAIANIHDEFMELQERIRNARREMNAYKIQNMLQNMGTQNPQLVERIRNGQADTDEVKQQIRDRIREMNQQQKVEAVRKITSEAVQRASRIRNIVSNVSAQIKEAVQERVTERIQNRLEQRQQILQSVQNMTRIRERILEQVNTQLIAQRIEQIANKYQYSGGAKA